ncbi:MAG: hypothetical protein FWB71_07315 [Defluviitaleaceae bacterium]|nr:hypothetical protein [Defluviitaleaceae bacterium]
MKITTTQAEKILKSNQAFTQLGFSMLVTRLKAGYANDPSPANVENCANQMNGFLEKFQPIMVTDFATISSL